MARPRAQLAVLPLASCMFAHYMSDPTGLPPNVIVVGPSNKLLTIKYVALFIQRHNEVTNCISAQI